MLLASQFYFGLPEPRTRAAPIPLTLMPFTVAAVTDHSRPYRIEQLSQMDRRLFELCRFLFQFVHAMPGRVGERNRADLMVLVAERGARECLSALHFAEQIDVNALPTSKCRFIISSVIGGVLRFVS